MDHWTTVKTLQIATQKYEYDRYDSGELQER